MRAIIAGLALCSQVALAQQPRLGTVNFPTSGSAAAQPHFLRGVGYLHSFEYNLAAQAFREAQRADPAFAMAYWGEAMTHNHPVWNQQALDSARAILARAPRTGTPKERAWLQAALTLYGEGTKPRRDTLYSRAMLRLVDEYPDDHEVRTFAALSLLGLNQAVREVTAYMRAAALAQPVFEANPDHPGAAHYLIHAFDDPVHAPLGLSAARAYSRIAPDAAHAQHMTTHIFLAMGMWEQVRSQNEIAANLTRWAPGHYTWWLGYGLLQQGRFADALAHLERVRAGMNGAQRGQVNHLTWMRGDYLVNTEDWRAAPASWSIANTASPAVVAFDQFVTGFSAARRGDRRAAGAARIEMVRQLDSLRARNDSLPLRSMAVLEKELAAMLQIADGQVEAGLTLAREAARIEAALPMEFGPPAVVKPAYELLGELLLEAGQPREAQAAFTRSLELQPGRARSLLGLVRAATQNGDAAVAADARARLPPAWLTYLTMAN